MELRAGRAEAARPLLARLVKEAPGYPGAAEALARARAESTPALAGSLHLRLLRTTTQDRAADARRRAKAGESFADLARAMSVDPSAIRGGDLGVVRLEDLAEPLRSAASALPPGGLSPVLEVGGTYVVLERER